MKKCFLRLFAIIIVVSMLICGCDFTNLPQDLTDTVSKTPITADKPKDAEFSSPFDIECKYEDGCSGILLNYESELIIDLLNNSEWILNDIPKARNDYTLMFDNAKIYYCSDIGAFWDEENQRYILLDNEAKAKVNDALQKEKEHFDREAQIKLFQYTWDGWGISYKTIEACDTLYNIIDSLNNMKKTGETVPKISDDVLELGGGEYPVERGTMWIEWENKIYRLSHDRSRLCLVDTHFGKGEVLEITEEFITNVNNAWYYAPYDYYSGTYRNSDDTFEIEHIFKSPSSVQMSVKGIDIANGSDFHDGAVNKITVELLSTTDQEITIYLDCQQSEDNRGEGDCKTVQLKKNVPATVELSFSGWSDICYWIYIQADYTKAGITIYP